MEPVSVAAGIFSLIQAGRSILRPFANLKDLDYLNNELLLFRLHLGILEEISQLTLASTTELPSTAQSCAHLCQTHLERVRDGVSKVRGDKEFPTLKELKRHEKLLILVLQPMSEFSKTVQLYRDVVMVSTTHSLLRDQQELQYSMDNMLSRQTFDQKRMQGVIDGHISAQQNLQKDYITQVTQLKQFATQGFANNSDMTRAGLDDLLSKMQSLEMKLGESQRKGTDTSYSVGKLGEVAAYHHTSERLSEDPSARATSLSLSQQASPLDRDRFSFSATIVGRKHGEIEHTVARAKMDTGCENNWISEELLIRAGLMESMETVESTATFLGFGGAAFEPLGKMEITWFGVNTTKSCKNHFLVHREGPFDMVLGSTWIAEESILILSQPALALRMTDFTKEERLIIDKNTKTKGATASQLSSLRRAEEAAARERKRQLKSVSLTTSSTALPTMNCSNLLTAQSFDPGSSGQLSQFTQHSSNDMIAQAPNPGPSRQLSNLPLPSSIDVTTQSSNPGPSGQLSQLSTASRVSTIGVESG